MRIETGASESNDDDRVQEKIAALHKAAAEGLVWNNHQPMCGGHSHGESQASNVRTQSDMLTA